VGGITPECSRLGALFYAQALEYVVPVSSTKVAEMVKLLETTFRMINIGLANEMALMCDRMGINVWEIIDAAATKPFGFMPFYPGPGLGGHCIPIDPFYLSWKTKQAGIEARFIELAGYSDIDDVRESPALDIIHLLTQRGAWVTYSDPFVAVIKVKGEELRAEPLEPLAAAADCVLIVTNHRAFDCAALVENARLIVDTRNALKGIQSGKSCACKQSANTARYD
jgi:UDP-N-acetyl-D-glucosamine dehydrogenase